MNNTNSQDEQLSFEQRTPDVVDSILHEAFKPVATETVSHLVACGRITAQSINADRDSPAIDTSAMDGFTGRIADFASGSATLQGEVAIGQAPPPLPDTGILRIVTGAPVPQNAEVVIPVEHTTTNDNQVTLNPDINLTPGQNIRRQGENLKANAQVLPAGIPIHTNVMSTIAAFGRSQIEVYKKVRIALLITGNELHDINTNVDPWQLRDSNGPTLSAMFAPLPYVDVIAAKHVKDDADTLEQEVARLLPECDMLLLTGGVSMGPYDYVPETIRKVGCETLFHKIPIRPGKPVLAARGPAGQTVMGLPGNPVSVMVTARRFASIALRQRAGFATSFEIPSQVELDNPDDKTLHFHWYRNVCQTNPTLNNPSRAALIQSKGSGDLVSAARSTGFIEVPANTPTKGTFNYYPWPIT